jgi:hypothetical protein
LIGKFLSLFYRKDAYLLSSAVNDSDFLSSDLFVNGEFLFADICSPPVFLTAVLPAGIMPHSIAIHMYINEKSG